MQQRYSLLILAGLALATACGDASGPRTSSTAFSRQISFPDLKSTLQGIPTSGAARVALELPATGFVARGVNVQNGEQVNDPERVRSRITALALNAAGDTGTLTLEPGFKVTFTHGSTFAIGDTTGTFQQFVDTVNAALAASPQVLLGVRVERTPTNPIALGPTDAFPAANVVLRGIERGHPKLRINVTQANLVDAGSGDCTMAKLGITPDGCLEVLGVTIGIAPGTDIDENNPGVIKAEFEGVVDCAQTIDSTLDPDGSFFLKGGPQVLINQDALGDGDAGDHGDDDTARLTLGQVARACAATPAPEIRTEGEGVLVSSSPAVIRATQVKFEQQNEEWEINVGS
ncbi:MAG TPA: hypothetical protein VKQ05_11855 [Gemmatimonadales bacterium]|nr:hypothetical protein [Gemmatimonadales bacterium]